jgi:hypothetical protein
MRELLLMGHTEAIVILIAGWAGSGKDAAASFFVNDHGFKRFAFADPLKEDVSSRTEVPLAAFHDPAIKDMPLGGLLGNKTPRTLLIERAAEVRTTDPECYVRAIGQQILAEIAATGQRRFVISDWRYRMESDYMRSLPGLRLICTRVERPGVHPSEHPSEHDLTREPIAAAMDNRADLEGLRGTVRFFLEIFVSPQQPT